MMSKTFSRSTLSLVAIGAVSAMISTCQQAQAQSSPRSIDVAVTYTAERAKVASVDCGCFWLQGGSGNVAFSFFHGLGVAVDVTGVHSGSVVNGVDTLTFTAGPRYTYSLRNWSHKHIGAKREVSLFGESLFGVAHGFNGAFPNSSELSATANSFALQVGGGVNLDLTPTLGIRAIEASYVRTTLPNSASNTQDDFRLGAGLNFHFHSR